MNTNHFNVLFHYEFAHRFFQIFKIIHNIAVTVGAEFFVDMPDFHSLFNLYISEFRKFDVFVDNTNVIALVDDSAGLMIVMFAFLCTFFKEDLKTAL